MKHLLFLISFAPLFVIAQADFKKNVAYLELAGAAQYYSINVERNISEKFTARIGAAAKKGELFFIPGAAYLKPVGTNGDRFLELGAGLGAVLRPSPTTSNNIYGYLNIGYRKQATFFNPVFWKVTFTPLLLRGEPPSDFLGYFMPWFSASVGYGF